MDPTTPRCRLRELGLHVGTLPPGPLNAITDVAGVGVGHVTLLEDQPHVVRSGVTAIVPLPGRLWRSSVFAGFDRYNGFGEVTGTHWIAESGLLSSPIVLTSAFSIGVARDTLLALPFQQGVPERWHQPCAAETYDGVLNDGLAAPVRRAHVEAAISAAAGSASRPVAEGAVGGGTGMMSFEFKSGIGTSSRCVRAGGQPYTVGVLVQSNFGNRRHLTVDGVPVGRELGYDVTPSPQRRDDDSAEDSAHETKGSIVIVVATDAPLLPPQLNRLARRANVGLSRVGGFGNNRSGDFALAFSTANALPFEQTGVVQGLSMLAGEDMNALLPAAAEAAEEAILNSLTMAATMTGVRGTTVHELPLRKLQELMQRHGRMAP
jgi:D-aminopeptidase